MKTMELQQRKAEADQRDQREREIAQNDIEFRKQQLMSTHDIQHSKLADNVGIQAAKNSTARDIAAAKEGNRLAEVNMKRADGARPKPQPAGKPPGGKGPPK